MGKRKFYLSNFSRPRVGANNCLGCQILKSEDLIIKKKKRQKKVMRKLESRSEPEPEANLGLFYFENLETINLKVCEIKSLKNSTVKNKHIYQFFTTPTSRLSFSKKFGGSYILTI